MDWLDLLAVQGTLQRLLQHHSSKGSILLHSALFIVQLSQPNMTTGKTIALTRCAFVGKVMSLLFNMLSRLVITFLPRKDSRRGVITFSIKHHTRQRRMEGSNKTLCAPGDPTETEPDLPVECLSVSCGGVGH